MSIYQDSNDQFQRVVFEKVFFSSVHPGGMRGESGSECLYFTTALRTEESLLNLVISNQIWVGITLFRLIWPHTKLIPALIVAPID